MTACVLLNGKPAAGLPFADRGLAYGDGLFETIKVIAGSPQFLQQHLQRLQRDCQRLAITLDCDTLRAEIALLLAQHHTGILKIVLTRTATARGYQPQHNGPAVRLLMFYPREFASAPNSGVCVRVCRQQLAEQPALAGMKHLNRLEQVLARAEWSDPQIAEGLMLDQRARLIEGTMSNIFLVRDGVVRTPQLHRCGVAGVMRQIVMEQLVAVTETDLVLDDVIAADEVFLTNSVIGIWPVVRIDCLHKSRGDVTIALQRSLQTLSDHEIR